MDFIAETTNFKVFYSYVPPSDTRHVTICYGEKLEHFAHAWIMQKDWSLEVAGKWCFNRGDVPIRMHYTPEKYYHESLENMLEYLEEDYEKFLQINLKDKHGNNLYEK